MLEVIMRVAFRSLAFALGYILFDEWWDARIILAGLLAGVVGALLIEAMDTVGRAEPWRRFRGELVD
jgi:hypothetical protein